MPKRNSRRNLTDRTLKSLKPAMPGRPYDVWDLKFPAFGVRVSDTGRRTFVLALRYPSSRNPTRRALGHYGPLTLEQARAKASTWVDLVAKGIDPAIEAERQKRAEVRRQKNSFAAVAEDFIRDKLPSERKGHEVAADIRRIFIPAWGKRPTADIEPLEVRNLVKGIKDAGKSAQARNVLGYARRLFNWAIDQHVYGLESSPCERLRPTAIIGKKEGRTRILNDAEKRAAWHAAAKLGFPYGSIYQLLMLTGQRRSEVAEASWSEIDLGKKLWTIPASRMKAGAAHVVPLSEDAVRLLQSLPRFGNNFIFSTKFGRKPVHHFEQAKRRLDAAMKAELGAEPQPFVIHDIRRTVRTGLSALPVPDLVRELVIAHTKPSLHKIYDQYEYLDEKRQCLELWAARLRDIVQPPPENIVKLSTARS
jgi:integrase